MRKVVVVVLAAIAVAVAACSDALAKRRGGWIPIPGFSKGEKLVKVRDFPARAPFIDEQGRQVHLGYHWSKAGEGKWVGYVGPTSYYAMEESALESLAREAGMDSLPPRPGKTSNSLANQRAAFSMATGVTAATATPAMLSAALTLLIVLASALWLVVRFLRAIARRMKSTPTDAQDGDGAWAGQVELVDRAAALPVTVPRGGAIAAAKRAPAVERPVPTVAPGGFARREARVVTPRSAVSSGGFGRR